MLLRGGSHARLQRPLVTKLQASPESIRTAGSADAESERVQQTPVCDRQAVEWSLRMQMRAASGQCMFCPYVRIRRGILVEICIVTDYVVQTVASAVHAMYRFILTACPSGVTDI